MRELIMDNQHSIMNDILFRRCLNNPANVENQGNFTPLFRFVDVTTCLQCCCIPLLFLPFHRRPSQSVSFAMNEDDDPPHISLSSSPPLGLRQNVPRDRSSSGLSPTPPTQVPPTLPECPMADWIRLHPCWHSNVSFTRTEETADADSWNNSYLASLVPTTGDIFKRTTFVQHLGLLSGLHKRQNCDLCQKTYQCIMAESMEEEYKENNTTVDEREISCSIFQDDTAYSWFRISVSTSFHICMVISDAAMLKHHLAQGNADIVMPRIEGHRITNCYP
jgi:hypothetical protein